MARALVVLACVLLVAGVVAAQDQLPNVTILDPLDDGEVGTETAFLVEVNLDTTLSNVGGYCAVIVGFSPCTEFGCETHSLWCEVQMLKQVRHNNESVWFMITDVWCPSFPDVTLDRPVFDDRRAVLPSPAKARFIGEMDFTSWSPPAWTYYRIKAIAVGDGCGPGWRAEDVVYVTLVE